MIDLFASEYKWSRDQILNEVYIDEYFIQKDIIDKRHRKEHLREAELQILPSLDKKEIEKFFKDLSREDEPTLAGKQVKTDFKAIADAKKKFS